LNNFVKELLFLQVEEILLKIGFEELSVAEELLLEN
jgi:hypothetical protein